MSANFKILHHRNSDNLHLKLIGDFDGSSAHELINAIDLLLNGKNAAYAIYIHTCSLSSVHPFALAVMKTSCTLKKLSSQLTYTGEYAPLMAFKNSKAV